SQRLFERNAETREQVETDYSAWQQQVQAVRGLERQIAAQGVQEEEQRILVRTAEREASDFQISAPRAGIIVELSAQVGQTVAVAEELGKVAHTADPIVEAEVDALFAPDVRVGQEVYLSAVGRPDTLAQ